MDFELSHAQQEIKDRVAEFADREVAPYATEWTGRRGTLRRFSRSSPRPALWDRACRRSTAGMVQTFSLACC